LAIYSATVPVSAFGLSLTVVGTDSPVNNDNGFH
jgi:hypothetical protein